jgi:4-hydroxythreonine-4-phosphate dehydrogenase
LTGAADCAAAFLGRAREVSILLDRGRRAHADVSALDLDTRSKSEKPACAIVRRAFAGRGAKRAAILIKKIDSTLRGHIAAELAAARQSLGRRPVLLALSFPAQRRTVRDSLLVLDGKPLPGDLRALLSGAGLPAAQVDLAAVRGSGLARAMRAALDTGARGLACDAVTDADLDRIARAGLALRPRPLFVGSAGLARALARTYPRKRPSIRPAASPRPVMTVVGSASPVSALQARRLARDPASILVKIDWRREPTTRDIPAVRRVGRLVAQAAPRVHYVLTGGETARAVLSARGIREIRLLGEVEPGVPFGMAPDGTLVCTKAGAFGNSGTLVKCVARLKREMNQK